MRKKILIVDDDRDLLTLLRSYFENEGFSITTAANGLDGLKQARSLVPDLILLDLVMPGMNGFSVCETLRREPATAAIPILMMTGLAGELDRFIGMDCGASEYVTKPVTVEELLSKVNALLAAQPVPRFAGKGSEMKLPAGQRSAVGCRKSDL